MNHLLIRLEGMLEMLVRIHVLVRRESKMLEVESSFSKLENFSLKATSEIQPST